MSNAEAAALSDTQQSAKITRAIFTGPFHESYGEKDSSSTASLELIAARKTAVKSLTEGPHLYRKRPSKGNEQ
jgi:hypothetical protein